jgi:hypothetical protein
MLVPSNPFQQSAAAPPRSHTSYAPASTAAAARVETLGRKIVMANPQAGLRPYFRTIGAPQPELFHVGTTEIDITEGLVSQCKTEGELAAVLCKEMGKMVSEREAVAGPQARSPEREPPPELRVGTDYAGTAGAPDQTRLAELGKFEKERRRLREPSLPPPDPQVLARLYLKNAGFPEKELESAAQLLQTAAQNNAFEKQMAR